jgi:hypothetical protein
VPIRRAAAGMVALVVGLAACGGGDANTVRVQSDAGAIPPDDVGLGEALAQVRGHHRASLEAYRAGDYKTARQHAFHPVHEIMASIASDLDPPAAEELEALLDEAAEAVADRVRVSEVETLYDKTAAATASALESAVDDLASDPAYQASVVASLLTTARHEYEEAAPNGKLVLTLEYQDGYAFVHEARALYEDFAGAESSSRIESQFDVLERALPSLEPPTRLVPPDTISGAASVVAEELESRFGATLVAEDDPDEVAENIESLLDEVVAAYESGETEEASELAAEAYLENYELIEGEVIEHAEDVNAELEPLLGAELRRQIEAGVSLDEIESLVSQAKELLSEAVRALE